MASTAKSIRPLETHIQQAVIAWKWLAIGQWPELSLLHSTPNGSFRGVDRKAAAINAARLKAEGMVPGWPDLSLPVRRDPYIGLAMEMKRPGEPLSAEQRTVLEQLRAAGHFVLVCYSAEQAIEALRCYLLRPVSGLQDAAPNSTAEAPNNAAPQPRQIVGTNAAAA